MLNRLPGGFLRPQSGSAWSNFGWALLLTVLFAGSTVAFVDRNVVGETDVSQMVAAVLAGHATGLGVQAGMHYNYNVSFAYYQALYLLPASILQDAGRLMAAVNTIGWLSACGSILLFCWALARLYTPGVALVAAGTLGFSPMYLELSTSGHPMLPALLFLAAGLLFFSVAIGRDGGDLTGMTATAAAAICWVASFCLRLDYAVALPALVLAAIPAWAASQPRSRFMLVAAPLLALAGYAALHWIIVGAGESRGSVGTFFATFYVLRNAVKGLAVLVLGSGIATCLAVAWTCVRRGTRPWLNGEVWLAVPALAVPGLAFWLPNSTPVRHFMLVILAFGLLLGLVLYRQSRPARALAFVVMLAVANQAIAELIHPTVSAHYQWSYNAVGPRRSTYSVPIGFFPYDHAANLRTFAALREEGEQVAAACHGPLLVFADQPFYILMARAQGNADLRLSLANDRDRDEWLATDKGCRMLLVQKYDAWPRDVVPEYLADPKYAGWQVYFQELTRGASDRTLIPESRQLRLVQ